MDGCSIEVNDSVHDILIGPGTVKQVMPDGSFEVEFRGPTRSMYYNPAGMFGSVRRLYWEDPIMVVPLKNERLSTTIRQLVKLLRDDRMYRSP